MVSKRMPSGTRLPLRVMVMRAPTHREGTERRAMVMGRCKRRLWWREASRWIEAWKPRARPLEVVCEWEGML
jgi:hypothetical protein